MSYYYRDPRQASNPGARPDCRLVRLGDDWVPVRWVPKEARWYKGAGWYVYPVEYVSDFKPLGPFDTETEALTTAREAVEE